MPCSTMNTCQMKNKQEETMKQLLITTIMFCYCLTIGAQQQRPQQQQRFDPKEYQQRFEAFTSERAGFTKDEAAKFFALYNEMKDKERSFYREYNKILRETKPETVNDKNFISIVNRMNELEIASYKLQPEYIKKLQKVVSPKKYFLFKKAEMRFHSKELRRRQGRGTPEVNHNHNRQTTPKK